MPHSPTRARQGSMGRAMLVPRPTHARFWPPAFMKLKHPFWVEKYSPGLGADILVDTPSLLFHLTTPASVREPGTGDPSMADQPARSSADSTGLTYGQVISRSGQRGKREACFPASSHQAPKRLSNSKLLCPKHPTPPCPGKAAFYDSFDRDVKWSWCERGARRGLRLPHSPLTSA